MLLLGAALGGPPAVPLLLAGGVAAMSWNGLSFTAAAEISGRRQAGKAMGIQNTAMRVVAAGVPVASARWRRRSRGTRSSRSWGSRRWSPGRCWAPLVDDERRRRREREARLESRAHAGGTAPMDAVGS